MAKYLIIARLDPCSMERKGDSMNAEQSLIARLWCRLASVGLEWIAAMIRDGFLDACLNEFCVRFSLLRQKRS